jgi:hypothetical protein
MFYRIYYQVQDGFLTQISISEHTSPATVTYSAVTPWVYMPTNCIINAHNDIL